MGKTVQWPETLSSHTGTPYRLYEAGEDYAFYYTASVFGFAHAKEILVRRAIADPTIVLVEERTLSGNAWGVTEDGRPRTVNDPSTLTWFHVTSNWFRSLDHWRACCEKKARPLTLKEIQRIVRRAQKESPRGGKS